ncbi:MAG: hypothetical protein O7A06_13760 [Acidobacteria bacterium]|nr:hypothetical protein [Acidobacteriota bacterium]
MQELKADKVIQSALGPHTYEMYVQAKSKEWDAFRLQVTPWELGKHLESY